MNTKKVAVGGILTLVVAAFVLGVSLYRKQTQSAQDQTVRAEQTRLVRMHSPVLGPQAAPVAFAICVKYGCMAASRLAVSASHFTTNDSSSLNGMFCRCRVSRTAPSTAWK